MEYQYRDADDRSADIALAFAGVELRALCQDDGEIFRLASDVRHA